MLGRPPHERRRQRRRAEAAESSCCSSAAFEQALEEADEDQDKVMALAVEYAIALQKSLRNCRPRASTRARSPFSAMPRRRRYRTRPLLKTKWIKERAAKLKAATTDDERRKLRLPRRQDLERDEPRRL